MNITTINVGLLSTNCYIVENKETNMCSVIDPGDDFDKIYNYLVSNNLTADKIIITHSHIDHIGAADELKSKTNAQIIISRQDGANFNNSNYNLSSALHMKGPQCKPDIYVYDNEVVDISGYKGRIIHTPGHTTGSICIYFEDENILFSGDTLFYESIGRTDFPGGSFSELKASICNKLYRLPDDTIVYPGHNNATTILHEKESNYYI